MARQTQPKHVRDNRSQQLDPQNPKYHKSRSASVDSFGLFPWIIEDYTDEELEQKKKDGSLNTLFPFKILIKIW